MRGWLGPLLAVGLAACGPSQTQPEALEGQLEALVERFDLPSLAVVVVADGEVQALAAVGVADRGTGRRATVDTLYGLASCSKPVVGLLAALAVERGEVTLDEDVNTWLAWPEPLAHPDAPDTPITLRHLLTHRSGVAADGPDDYDTYPKPDPDQPLDGFLQALLADPAYWTSDAPGEGETYSNLGAALAGAVLEAATGRELRALSQAWLFDPLGLGDTRWFYADLSAEQQARHAIPHGEDGEPLQIYAFNDYPSGSLRASARDLGRLLVALTAGHPALPEAALDRFEAVPMLINADHGGPASRFDHSGGEAGVNTYFTYDEAGRAYGWLTNGDLDDADLDALAEALDRLLGGG